MEHLQEIVLVKSTMGCAEDCAWLRGERPWVAIDDPARRSGVPQHAIKGLVIVNDGTKSRRFGPVRTERFGGSCQRTSSSSGTRNHSGAIDTVVVTNPFGSTLTLRFDTVRSWMINPLGSELSDWDFIHVDEPCPEGMFKAAARGSH